MLTWQMALRVWKDGLLEQLRQQLVAALLEEIRRSGYTLAEHDTFKMVS